VIRVEEAPEPTEFDEAVRRPGLIAVAEMAGLAPPFVRGDGNPFKRRTHKVTQSDGVTVELPCQREDEVPPGELPTYWTAALPAMMRAYRGICAYSCFRIHRVTGAASVDHMAPKSRAWDKVYEWRNYRLACSRMNARKGDFDAVLDPFAIEDHWFELELVGFQVKPARLLAEPLRHQIRDTVRRLRLNDWDCWKGRERDAERYWCREVSLQVLLEDSPFVARELRRQGRLNAGDVG
jgi:hypothetical protein